MIYAEQLKHPKWQRRRLEILQRADFKCERCGADDKTLHVHHKKYRDGALAWEYADDELVSLCEPCHDYQHKLVRTEAEFQQVLAESLALIESLRADLIKARAPRAFNYFEPPRLATIAACRAHVAIFHRNQRWKAGKGRDPIPEERARRREIMDAFRRSSGLERKP